MRKYSLKENESAEHCQTAVERDGLRDCQTAHTEGESQRSEGTQSHDGNTSEKRTSPVEILVIPIGEVKHR